MLVKCAKCSHVFEAAQYGLLQCPSCHAELMLRAPGQPAPPQAAPPGPPPAGAEPPVAPAPSATPSESDGREPSGAEGEGVSAPAPAEAGAPPPAPPPADQPPGGAHLPSAAAPEAPQDQSTPWEERGPRGIVGGLVETVRRSFVDPVGFFARMRADNANGAISYYWILTGLGTLVSQIWQALAHGAMQGLAFPTGDSTVPDWFSHPLASLGAGIGAAVFAPVGLFVSAGLLHLMAMLFRQNRHGFDATLRAVAYSAGPSILGVVPICGAMVGGVWTLVLTVIGIWKLHRMTLGWAVAVVLAPAMLGVCCVCGTVGLVGSAIAGLVGSVAAFGN